MCKCFADCDTAHNNLNFKKTKNMIIKKVARVREDVFQNRAVVSVDFGTKRFGVAHSDKSGIIATPFVNYERLGIDQDVDLIRHILQKYDSNILLFGYPKDEQNKNNKIIKQIESFADIVNNAILDINIFFFDERYSSKAAEQITKEKEFRNVKDDKIAATIFLQAFLDFKNNK